MTDLRFERWKRIYSEDMKNWVRRMRASPVELVQEFEVNAGFEFHNVYLLKLSNGKGAVIRICCDDTETYEPDDAEILVYDSIYDAKPKYIEYVQWEVQHVI